MTNIIPHGVITIVGAGSPRPNPYLCIKNNDHGVGAETHSYAEKSPASSAKNGSQVIITEYVIENNEGNTHGGAGQTGMHY